MGIRLIMQGRGLNFFYMRLLTTKLQENVLFGGVI